MRKLSAQLYCLCGRSDRIICQPFATDRPRRIWHGLARSEYTTLYKLADGFAAYVKDLRGCIDSDYSIAVALGIEHRDAVMIPQRVDP